MKVVSVKVSPLNPKQWNISLECGHDYWITAKSKPKKKQTNCSKCKPTYEKIKATLDRMEAEGMRTSLYYRLQQLLPTLPRGKK